MQLDQLVAHVIGVLDHLRVDAAHPLGHSLGALTAVETAIRQPARAKSVTSLSGVYGVEGKLPELITLQRDPAHRTVGRACTAASDARGLRRAGGELREGRP